MTRHQPLIKTVLSEIANGDDRSSLFWWLVEHHDEIMAAANGRRMQWRRLCARFAELGLTDRTGKPATEKLARLTWFRARQEVARLRGLAVPAPARAGSVYPSRTSKEWRPTVVSQQAAPGTQIAAPPPVGPGMSLMEKLTGKPEVVRKTPSQDRDREIDERLAAARADMASRSR